MPSDESLDKSLERPCLVCGVLTGGRVIGIVQIGDVVGPCYLPVCTACYGDGRAFGPDQKLPEGLTQKAIEQLIDQLWTLAGGSGTVH